MKHPYVWSVWVPLIIATLVSVFGTDIRLALSAAARKGGHRYRRNSLLRAENILQHLNWLHGNAYNLLLWLVAELRWPLFATLATVNAWFFNPKYREGFGVHFVASLALGVWFGGVIRISRIVELLEHYDRSKADLEKRIAELKNATPRIL